MEIILGRTAGFCGGMTNAIQKTKEILNMTETRPIYSLGEIAHNRQLMDELESQGLKVVDKLNKDYKKIIIRPHGVPKSIYKEAEEKGIELLDLTCPKVTRVHKIAEEYEQKGFYIILIGEKGHPEVLGTYSFCGENARNIEEIEEIDDTIQCFKESNKNKIAVIVHTTFSMEKFDLMTEKIKEKVNQLKEENNKKKEIHIEINKTICDATRLRQEETKKIAKEVELMIIIGGKKSSNTNKLFDISKKYCKNAIFIQTKDDIDIAYIRQFEKVGIMAGASTPKDIIEAVISYIKK